MEKKTVTEKVNVKPSLQEEVTNLKRVAAGQKGQLKVLQGKLEKNKETINEKDKLISAQKKEIATLIKTVGDRNLSLTKTENALESLKVRYTAIINMPWWKRIFVKE